MAGCGRAEAGEFPEAPASLRDIPLPSFPKEAKPDEVMASRASAILLYAARHVFNLPFFALTDDAKD